MQALVCISHLRWDFVWQRPQQLLSRLAERYHVIFVEEPITVAQDEATRLDQYEWRGEDGAMVTVMRLMQPAAEPHWIGHGDPQTSAVYGRMLKQALQTMGIEAPLLWLYTPMADGFIDVLDPETVIYDVMDQLAAFRGAPPELIEREHSLLRRADVVFTGGISLYRDKLPYNPNTYLFPSGVDSAHFAGQPDQIVPADMQPIAAPRVGYFGVIDERMDMALLAAMAEAHPEWSIVMIGPVVKIAAHEIAQAPNLHYLGMRSYGELPAYLAAFDVALIPFALSEATQYLSPTKTLEYMAAHKPIVSTPIQDVVELYGAVVGIGATHEAFIAAVADALQADDAAQRYETEQALLQANSWDTIAAQMQILLDTAVVEQVSTYR